jgi:hypothetical protein
MSGGYELKVAPMSAIGVGIETDEDRRLAKLLQSPEGILDWIAVPNFLDARS